MGQPFLDRRRDNFAAIGDLAIMPRIDVLHMHFPFAGSQMLRDLLAAEGIKVSRLHVSTLMKKNGDRGDLPAAKYLEAGAGAQDYPYLRRWTSAMPARNRCRKPFQM